MNIPANIRRQVGLENGGPVMISVVDGEVRMRVLQRALSDLQDEARTLFGGTDVSVDAFLADRREESRREDVPA